MVDLAVLPRIALALLVAVGGACASTRAPSPESAPEPPPAANAPEEKAQPPPPTPAAEPVSIPRRLGNEVVSDFKWTVNNFEADAEDLVLSPCHVGELLENPAFYWTSLASAAALGAGFGLDNPAQHAFHKISHNDADSLERWGNAALWGATAGLYAYGLALDDPRARHYALTGLFSTAVSSGLTAVLKVTFGRDRPYQDQGHWKWFNNGRSFVSSATTPVFSLAAAVSEYADNRWYVALPAYTAAASVGLGRMGKNAHWISDIIGSALLGVGTTEVLLYMHDSHEAEPSRYRIFPVLARDGGGVGVSWDFWGP